MTVADKGRLVAQRGVATVSVGRTTVLVAALGATAYSWLVGRRVGPSEMASDGPRADTDPDVAAARRQLRVLHWTVSALTGVMLVLNALQGEQQRPVPVVKGVVERIVGT